MELGEMKEKRTNMAEHDEALQGEKHEGEKQVNIELFPSIRDNLGTRREWRGKGVAPSLIAHSLHAFAAADCTHASISVDSENPTGAAHLYRRLGFEPQHRSITHEIALA